MPWGGARSGSGRKPKREKPLALVDAREAFSSGPDLRTPPADLPDALRPIWTRYAALAVERRTLIVATVPAFTLLCEIEVKKAAADVAATRGGVSEMRLYLQLAKQVEALMARFGLAPFGKAIAQAPKAAANPTDRYMNVLSGGRK